MSDLAMVVAQAEEFARQNSDGIPFVYYKKFHQKMRELAAQAESSRESMLERAGSPSLVCGQFGPQKFL